MSSRTVSTKRDAPPKPKWTVHRGPAVDKAVVYLLVDVAESGIESVIVRVVGCHSKVLNGSFSLRGHAAKFTVPAEETGGCPAKPTITVQWFDSGDQPETWSGRLP